MSPKRIFFGKNWIEYLKHELRNTTPITVKHMPGPRPVLPLIGTSYIYWPFGAFRKYDRTTTQSEKMLEKYGPIYREKRGGTWIVHLHTSDNIKEVMRKQGKLPVRIVNEPSVNYRKSNPAHYHSVGSSDLNGEDWRTFRKKVAPVLARRPSPEIVRGISDIADEVMTMIEDRKDKKSDKLSIFSLMQRYSTEAIWFTVYGRRGHCLSPLSDKKSFDISSNACRLFESFIELHKTSLWKYISTPAYRKLVQCEKISYSVHQDTYREILFDPKAPANRAEESSLFQQFVRDGQLTDKELITISMDSTTSGTYVACNFMSMLLHKLTGEPLAYKKLQREVDAMLESPSDVVTSEKLRKMQYLKAVFKEGSRIAGPIPFAIRLLPEDINLDGYIISKHTPIFCHVSAPSKLETNFRWPEKFIPERWLSPDHPLSGPEFADLHTEAGDNSFLVLPFGFGIRSCLGRAFGQTNIEVMIAKLVRNFSMSSTGKLRVGNKYIIGPLENVNITFKRRLE